MMRVAFFDGILETHVADSFQRAFERRGHQVFNTGKIGHGFEFATDSAALGVLSRALDQVIDFKPDWIFCFRPASLPAKLLRRAQASGAKLAAWFSDDPVLFDLTYGPVVDQYDLILHCGNERVLEFYENQFGRPTGVNFPFWTDQMAFPRVWGAEEPIADAMFLGNMHDAVRRQRYFDLGPLAPRVVAYGNIGADYFGLSHGYLDSDDEVVCAAARVRSAISVPQYFVDHRGLPTWFSGLDRLGFFEYPSRIIQYMSMGLPVINLVKEPAVFDTFPEMIVVNSVAGVSRELDRLHEIDLPSLSDAVFKRFVSHFSADARVQAFEHLTVADDWRSLSVGDRVRWFTSFEGSDNSAAPPSETPERESIVLRAPDSPPLRIAVISDDLGPDYGRFQTTVRALRRLGHEVVEVSDGSAQGMLVPDQAKRSAFAVMVPRVLGLDAGLNGIVVCTDALLTESGARLLREAGVWSLLLDDAPNSSWARAELMSQRYSVFASSNPKLVQQLQRASHKNTTVVHHFIDAEAQRILSQHGSDLQAAIRVQATPAKEEAAAPGYSIDLGVPAHSWAEYAGKSLEELATAFGARVAYVSFDGTRENPIIPQEFPALLAAADYVIAPRHATWAGSAQLQGACRFASMPREIAFKTQQLAESPTYARHTTARRELAILSEFSAETQMARLLRRMGVEEPKLDPSEVALVLSAIRTSDALRLRDLPFDSSAQGLILGLTVTSSASDPTAITVEFIAGESVVGRLEPAEAAVRLAVRWTNAAQLECLSLRARLRGSNELAYGERVHVAISECRGAVPLWASSGVQVVRVPYLD